MLLRPHTRSSAWHRLIRFLAVVVPALLVASTSHAQDWAMFGRDWTRNSVSAGNDPPVDWEIEHKRDDGVQVQARNVKWSAPLGSNTIGSPIVAGGLVWLTANNEGHHDPAFTKDAGCLLCFDEKTGQFLYQHLTPRVGSRIHDWPFTSQPSPPLIEADRAYFITNRWEAVCLDIAPLLKRTGSPREVWKLDMTEKLGVHGTSPGMAFNLRCAIGSSYHGKLYVITGNGVDETHNHVAAPKAPALICLEKETGNVLWSDNSPGENVLATQCSSPLVGDIGGRGQCIAAMGDGWVRSFDPMTGKLLWKFDLNRKAWEFPQYRSEVMGTPVLYDGHIYIATGQDVEHGEGPGVLWCIDPTKEGDISEELDDEPINPDLNPETRIRGGGGHKGKPNPNFAGVWRFESMPPSGPDKKVPQRERMHRMSGSVAAADGLVIAADFDGFVHCLDAKTGQHYWSHDTEAAVFGTPLICDGRVFIANEDGDISILALSPTLHVMARHETGEAILASPVLANGVLYLPTRSRVYAIEQKSDSQSFNDWPQWRGRLRNNVSDDRRLLQNWPRQGPPLLWKYDGLGDGVPPVALSAQRVFTSGYRGGEDFLTCLDAATGKKLWEARLGRAPHEETIMRWLSQRAPTVDEDRVYDVTALGELVCLSVEDGRELWRRDYVREFGGPTYPWGCCDFPLVDGPHLICTPAGPESSIVALSKFDGKTVWTCAVPGCNRVAYSALMPVTIAGRPQYVQQFTNSIVGVSGEGRLLWQQMTRDGSLGNVHTTLVRGDEVFGSCGWGVGATLLSITRDKETFTAAPRYSIGGSQVFGSWFGNSCAIGDSIYTSSAVCLEWSSGKGRWRRPRDSGDSGRMTMVAADGSLYFHQGDGTLVLAEINPKEYVEHGRFSVPHVGKEPAWTTPVVTGGRMYVRDLDKLLCYDVRQDRSRPFAPGPGAPAHPATATVPVTTAATTRPNARDAVFVPTPHDVADRMLALAGVKKDDIVYDLGSGDGRILIAAAKTYGCHAVGYEVDPQLVRESREEIDRQQLGSLVTVEPADLFTADLSKASVVTLYVGRDVNRRLVPQLEKLKRGSRIVSNSFEIEGYAPDKTLDVKSSEDDTVHTLYLWVAPLKKKP